MAAEFTSSGFHWNELDLPGEGISGLTFEYQHAQLVKFSHEKIYRLLRFVM